METPKFFIPKRQIFMAGPEQGSEAEKRAPKGPGQEPQSPDAMAKEAKDRATHVVGAGIDSVVALDTDKPRVEQKEPISAEEMKKLSKGFPEVSIDGKQDIINAIKAKFAADNKDKDKSYQTMMHRDSGNMIGSDGYEYVLVIDANHNPKERLFKGNEKHEAPAEQLDLDESVGSLIKPYNELPTNDQEYKTTLNQLKSKVKKHGDSEMTGIVKDGVKTGWVLLKDDTAKDKNGYRVFKGTPV